MSAGLARSLRRMSSVSATVLQFTRYGGPEVLELATVEVPDPGAGEVRIDVRAAAVNPFDAKARSGRFGRGEGGPAAPVRVGFDLAGVVEAVGPDVAGIAVGDEVLGLAAGGGGAMATYALAGPVAPKPADMSWIDAAAWPTVTEAATRGLEHLALKRGETLLVHGGAGSVGLVAVQLGLRAGARVIATAAERDHGSLAGRGAIAVTYGDGWADRVRAAAGDGSPVVDAVLDAAGTGVLADSVALAGGTARVLTLAGDDAEETGVTFSGGGDAAGKARAIRSIPGLYADGVRVPVGGVFGFADAMEAYNELERGARGKLVVSVPAESRPV